MDYGLLRELLTELERYQAEATPDEQQLPHFAQWLFAQHAGQPTLQQALANVPDPQQQWEAAKLAVERELSQLVVHLGRYARHYVKQALDGSRLTTMDDFTYLSLLLGHGELTKTEMFLRNIQEKTSGTEVIKRLLAAGLIEQSVDVHDRRSKRVRITEQGRAELFRIFQRMTTVATVVAGPLTDAEKFTLVALLRKLDAFHNPIFRHERDLPLNELAERVQYQE